MELVYLWVENYKNIEKQGFNFSPRFEYEFDDEKLIYKGEKDYVNIFPENINITAIVGKNGSGKSGVLKAFLERFISESKSLIENDNKSEMYRDRYPNDRFHNGDLFFKDKEILELSKTNKKDVFTVYWDYSITDESFKDIRIEDDRDFYDFKESRNYLLQPTKIDYENNSNINIQKDIQDLAFNMIENDFDFDLIKNFFNPTHIIINAYDELHKSYSTDSGEIVNYFKDYYSESGDNYYKYKIDKLPSLKRLIKKNKIKHDHTINNLIIDFLDSNDKGLIFLSFGEIQLLKILYNLSSLVKKIENETYKSIVFLLDELELGLHPEWQKKIISFLVNIESKIPIHYILTTHSPFLLSDLPRENIIFLDRDENGNCKNVSNEININSFGANIHTLLSNGFFMDNGLMGEFAKNKITEILKFLNGEEELQTIQEHQIKPIINSIGEDFLRNKLLNLYDKKYLQEAKEQKKEIIKRQIASLQKDLEELDK